jgi:hypothetical protein
MIEVVEVSGETATVRFDVDNRPAWVETVPVGDLPCQPFVASPMCGARGNGVLCAMSAGHDGPHGFAGLK